MATTLVTIPFSHFCEKARWALERAGVPFQEEGHAPGLHRLATRRAGGLGPVPMLVCDGRVIDGSTAILLHADALASPAMRLLPDDGTDRDEALALVRRFDDELGPHARRLVYHQLLPDRGAALAVMRPAVPAWEHLAVRAAYGPLRRSMQRFMKIDDAGAARSLDVARRLFDDMGARLAAGRRYLVGDRFGAADLTFASLAGPLLGPEEYGAELPRDRMPAGVVALLEAFRATPAGAFALEVYREHRRSPGRG